MANLKITLACWNYDRTRGLMDGSIRPEGVDLTYRMAFVAEIFERMVRNKEFEVSELGLTFYLRSLELENPRARHQLLLRQPGEAGLFVGN